MMCSRTRAWHFFSPRSAWTHIWSHPPQTVWKLMHRYRIPHCIFRSTIAGRFWAKSRGSFQERRGASAGCPQSRGGLQPGKMAWKFLPGLACSGRKLACSSIYAEGPIVQSPSSETRSRVWSNGECQPIIGWVCQVMVVPRKSGPQMTSKMWLYSMLQELAFEAFLFCGTATDHIIPAQCELMDEYAMAATQE